MPKFNKLSYGHTISIVQLMIGLPAIVTIDIMSCNSGYDVEMAHVSAVPFGAGPLEKEPESAQVVADSKSDISDLP
ncbi:MAG TPA: hypothetical protein VEH76_09525 [Methylocystis sp.]|nr:hypothetical protein [Methylocystis sp.]